MLNTEAIYFDSGAKAGKARALGDEGAYRFEKQWLSEALALECQQDKPIAQAAYDRGYRTGYQQYKGHLK